MQEVPAKIVELVDVQSLFGQEVLNVFHYVDEDGVADEATLVSTFSTDVIPLILGSQVDDLTHVAIRHRQVYPTAELAITDAITPVQAGTDTSDPLASADALSIKWNLGNPTVVLSGGFTGHIKRGGCRLAGPGEDMVVGNSVIQNVVNSTQAWIAELLLPGEGPWQLCVASFLIGNRSPGDPPRARSETVTAYTIVRSGSDPAPSTQNSRKVLRGRTR